MSNTLANRRLTFPAEHGALVTLAGAALLAALLAPHPEVAIAAAAVVAALYLARGPIERKVKRLRLRTLDPLALIAYAIAAAACLYVVARSRADAAWLLGAIAIAIPIAGATTRSAALRRSVLVEVGGMIAVGATAGADLYAGGGTVDGALFAGAALASYSAAAIFIVRAHTRPLERRDRIIGAWIGVAFLAAGAAISAALYPRMALAFVPRGAHALARTVFVSHTKRIKLVALRESLELALFVALIAAIWHVG